MTVTYDKTRVVTTYRINGLIQESYSSYLFLSREFFYLLTVCIWVIVAPDHPQTHHSR